MTNGCCTCRRDCTLWALIISVILGIVVAFLQVTAVIVLPVTVPMGAFALAVVYLATVLVVSALLRCQADRCCLCSGVYGVLAGALLTALAAVVLMVVPLAADSIATAVVVGILAGAISLTLTATVCLVRCLTGCNG